MVNEESGHYVYIVECADRTLYTGYTVNVARRIAEHNAGRAAKYTRGRRPVTLRYVEAGDSRSWALKREREIKALTREAKWELVGKRGNDHVATEVFRGTD